MLTLAIFINVAGCVVSMLTGDGAAGLAHFALAISLFNLRTITEIQQKLNS